MKSLLKLHWTKQARIQITKQIECHKSAEILEDLLRPPTFGKDEEAAMDELANGNLSECFEKLLNLKSIQSRHKLMMKSLLKLHLTKQAKN